MKVKKIENRKIGVIGGMGPQASVRFYEMLIQKSIKTYKTVRNEDYPDIFLHSVPVPDFIANADNLQKATSMLIQSVTSLNNVGATSICIACNTAHILIDILNQYSGVPMISIIDEVNSFIIKNQYRRVGLLSTETTKRLGLYQKLNNKKTKLFTLSKHDQIRINSIIFSIIAGKSVKKDQDLLFKISLNFAKNNKLNVLVLGCTELPLIFPSKFHIPVINTLELLVDRVLRLYYGY